MRMRPRHLARPVAALCLAAAALLGCRIVVKPDYMLDKLEYGRPYLTDNFVVYLEAGLGEGSREEIGVWLEEIYERVGDLLEYFPDRRTTVKIYSSPLPATEELEFYGYAGEHAIYSKKYPGTRRNLAHEYTHLVAARIAGVTIPAYFNEGLATFVSNHLDGPESPTLEEEIYRFTHGDFLHKHSLLGAHSIRHLPTPPAAIREAYAYRSSFISFIVEEFGFESILETLRRAKASGGVEPALAEVIGLPIDELDRQWEVYLRSHTDPERYRRYGLIRDWYVIGPFDNSDGQGFHRTFAPETGVDLDATYKELGQNIRWRRFRSNHPVGVVNLHHGEFSPSHHVVAYAVTYIDSPSEREVEIRAGAANSLTLWLNGERRISLSTAASFRPDDTGATVRLEKGRNEILVKVCQFAHDWMFAVRITDGDGEPVPGLRFVDPAAGPHRY